MPFHVRVTLNKEQATIVCKQIVAYFKPARYVCGYEEKGSNKHMHMHLEFDEPEDETYLLSNAGKTYKSAFFKKIGFGGLYYFQECKDQYANKLYVCKDLDIIAHNYDKEDFDQIINETTKINENKKKDTRHKLLEMVEARQFVITLTEPDEDGNVYEQRYDQFVSLASIAKFIHNVYIYEWDKEPSPNIRAYTLYVAEKMRESSANIVIQLDHYYDKMFN